MTTWRSNIPQHDGLGIKIIDHQIKSTITIEISDRETASGPRVRQRISRWRTHTLKLPLHVSEKQRLLCVTRAPLVRVGGRINVTIDDEQIEPPVIVVVDETRSPTQKRNRHLTEPNLKRY